MATGPVQGPSDARSTGQDPETLRFRRLDRVRRRRQTRRRRRLILAVLSVLAVAGASIIGFTSIVQQSVQHGRDHLAVPPAAATIPVVDVPVPAAVTGSVTVPPAPPTPPAPSRAESGKREGAQRSQPRSSPRADEAPATQSTEPDPAAVVDWLLRGSRTRAQ